MIIRKEQPADYRAVEELTRDAFWDVYRPGCVEHFVLNRYREHPDFMGELDLVMEDEGSIVGHVMFAKAKIMGDDGAEIPAWTFGPISIRPDRKRQGLGLRLLKHALALAKEQGIGLLCMEGNIEFYRHAGFVVASTLGIHYHGEPADAEVPYFLAQELTPGYLNGRKGTYHTPEPYMVADRRPEEFEAYEKTFAPRQKHFAAGQLPMICQSCGMPLTKDEDCGTNADGSQNYDYCTYCYQDGRFLQECTMEQMIDHCAEMVDLVNEHMPRPLTKQEYKDMMHGYFPMLKRWRQ